MVKRIIWPLLTAGVLYLAYGAFEGTTERLADVRDKGPSIEERVLSDADFFYEEFSQRQLMRLRTAEKEGLVSVDRVAEPRPRISEVIAQYGQPDRVEETTLVSTRESVTIYHYGRLGLAIPKSREDGAVFWLVIR